MSILIITSRDERPDLYFHKRHGNRWIYKKTPIQNKLLMEKRSVVYLSPIRGKPTIMIITLERLELIYLK